MRGSRAIACGIPPPHCVLLNLFMVNRTRVRLIESNGSGFRSRKITTNPVVTTSFNWDTNVGTRKLYKTCDDVIGLPGQDHPLTIVEYDNRGFVLLNGYRVTTGGGYTEMSNYIPTAAMTPVTHEFVSIPSIGERATTLRARTNPSREEVSIPNFLYEMKDLPHMIRQLRNLGPLLRNLRHRNSAALSAIASQYLGYEFGWKPLISDISQLLQFQVQVDRRIVELNRLYSGTGLKRRLNLFDGSTMDESGVIADSSVGVTISCRKTKITRVRSWGTIRWRPTVVPKDIGHQALGKRARRLVHGIDHYGVDAVQAWNAIPFTWLADWFGNFGTYLEAHRNDVPAAPTGPSNIMTLTETYEGWTRRDSNLDFVGGEGLRVLRTKARSQSSGTLSAHLPLATARQFSILAALNLQRKKR